MTLRIARPWTTTRIAEGAEDNRGSIADISCLAADRFGDPLRAARRCLTDSLRRVDDVVLGVEGVAPDLGAGFGEVGSAYAAVQLRKVGAGCACGRLQRILGFGRRLAHRGDREDPVRLFRSAQLNLFGWMAVAALCLIGAATGYGIGSLAGGPVAVWLVIGAVLCPVMLVVVDRRRWGRLWTGYSWDDTPEATESAGRELKRRGLAVTTTMSRDGRIALRYRNRDGRQVARALSQLGIHPPDGR